MECYYKLRVDLSTVSSESFVLWLTTSATVWCYAVEGVGTTNPHVHAYLATTVKEPALRKRLRGLGGAGNGFYSLGKLQEEWPMEYLAYISKQSSLHCSPGFPVEIVQKAKDLVLSYKKKKKSKASVLEQISSVLSETPTSREIADAIINYHLENGLLLRKFLLESYYDTLMCKHHQRYRENLIRTFFNENKFSW